MEKEKTYNLYEVMEKLTGMNKSEQMKIMEEVQENRKRLEGCSLHDFSIEVPKPYTHICPDYKCSHCGGKVSSNEKMWYERGLQHASKIL